jgi:hypothetical protein
MNKLNIKLKKNLSIGFNPSEGLVVMYKDFPLWRTAEGLDQLEIKIYDPTKRKYQDDPDYYLLQCKDSLGDYYYYGRFHDLDELQQFLSDPFEFHEKQELIYKMLLGGV